jgi:hypothetical protein
VTSFLIICIRCSKERWSSDRKIGGGIRQVPGLFSRMIRLTPDAASDWTRATTA